MLITPAGRLPGTSFFVDNTGKETPGSFSELLMLTRQGGSRRPLRTVKLCRRRARIIDPGPDRRDLRTRVFADRALKHAKGQVHRHLAPWTTYRAIYSLLVPPPYTHPYTPPPGYTSRCTMPVVRMPGLWYRVDAAPPRALASL